MSAYCETQAIDQHSELTRSAWRQDRMDSGTGEKRISVGKGCALRLMSNMERVPSTIGRYKFPLIYDRVRVYGS